jgi:hypothetical protein
VLPTVFLSLSGVDQEFVSRVHENLPDGLAYFYPESFENGERLLDAMEKRVEQTSVFALFASRQALDSHWVQFEIDRARLAKIRRPGLRCLVFPLDADVTYHDLPNWMQEYWIGTAGQTARDVARYIRGVLTDLASISSTAIQPLGRGTLVDQARRELLSATFTTKASPNAFVFAGHAGIGRRTVEKQFLQKAFPAMPELAFGPEFELPQFADLSDIYRAIRREIEDHFSLKAFEDDLAKFLSQTVESQVQEIVASLSHFATLGQAVTIVTGSGLYEDRGILRPWVPILLKQLEELPALKLCIISNRQLNDKDLRPHKNALQYYVGPLVDEDIKALIIAVAPIFGGEPQLPNDSTITLIGGHPTVARSVARLLAKRGPLIVEGDPRQIFDIQEEVLSESLSFDSLTMVERDILSVLSWVPQLNSHLLRDTILGRHNIAPEDLASTIDYLMAGCLVQISGSNYLISAPIRGMFRRKHGYGSVELRTSFASQLRAAWAEAVDNDELKTELFDAFVYMTALEGGSLPKEFSGLLLASTLQDVVREAYDRRHIDEDSLKRAVAWGLPAKQMRMDETTREEILSYVLRSQVRLQRYDDARETLLFMQKKSYRSASYLEAFLIRLSGGDLTRAVALLRKAREIKKYMNSVIADLAICLKALGRWPDLETLLGEEEARVARNPVLLDIRIGMLIAAGKYKEAERQIDRLRAMPFDDGRADSRSATVLMNRDHDFARAQQLLTAVLDRQTRGALGVRRLRALAAARGGSFPEARSDTEYLRARPGGEDTFHRIEAEIKLVQKDYDGAEGERSKVKFETVQDRLLQARILEAQAADTKTPLGQRDGLLGRASSIRFNNRIADEYDSAL